MVLATISEQSGRSMPDLTCLVHCSLLAEDAIKSAIKDYQQKREKRLAMAAVRLDLSSIPIPCLLLRLGKS